MRLAARRLEEPLEYYIDFAQRMVGEMEILEEAGRTSDVLFVGTSMVQLGIDVAPFEHTLDGAREVHKVALPGAQASLVERWLLDEVAPRLRPERVVWGVSSLDFNGNRPEKMLAAYLQGRAVRQGGLAAIDRFMARHSFLVRYRSHLRNPIALADDLLDGTPLPSPVDVDSLLSEMPRPKAARTPAILAEISGIALGDYAVGEGEIEAFRRTVAALRQNGAEVVIVVMPVPDEYVAAHPDGADDYSEFRTALDAEIARLGLELLDYGNAYPTAAFADYTHLRPAEARRFSQQLAHDLAGIGW